MFYPEEEGEPDKVVVNVICKYCHAHNELSREKLETLLSKKRVILRCAQCKNQLNED